MIQQFKGTLEIDSERGVIYFHHETGTTILRISSLPTPIPADPANLLDITHNVGVNWGTHEPNPECLQHGTDRRSSPMSMSEHQRRGHLVGEELPNER